MEFAALELHLLLVELILYDVRAALRPCEASVLLLSLLLVVELARADRDALSVVACILATSSSRVGPGSTSTEALRLHDAEATICSTEQRLTTSTTWSIDSLVAGKGVLGHSGNLVELASAREVRLPSLSPASATTSPLATSTHPSMPASPAILLLLHFKLRHRPLPCSIAAQT